MVWVGVTRGNQETGSVLGPVPRNRGGLASVFGWIDHPGNPLASARVDAVTGVEGEGTSFDPTKGIWTRGLTCNVDKMNADGHSGGQTGVQSANFHSQGVSEVLTRVRIELHQHGKLRPHRLPQ